MIDTLVLLETPVAIGTLHDGGMQWLNKLSKESNPKTVKLCIRLIAELLAKPAALSSATHLKLKTLFREKHTEISVAVKRC